MDPQACLNDIIAALFHIRDANSLHYYEVLDRLEALANWWAGIDSDSTEADNFSNGDTEYSAADVLIGAYWFCVDYHSGGGSVEYRLSCAISRLYTPGPMCSGPEPATIEADAYAALVDLLENHR